MRRSRQRHIIQQRRPRNDGLGDVCQRHSIFSRPASGVVGTRALSRLLRDSAQALMLIAIRLIEGLALLASSRLATTPTAREASSTCTVLWLNWGAIFTAVCCALVVAPRSAAERKCPTLHFLGDEDHLRRGG